MPLFCERTSSQNWKIFAAIYLAPPSPLIGEQPMLERDVKEIRQAIEEFIGFEIHVCDLCVGGLEGSRLWRASQYVSSVIDLAGGKLRSIAGTLHIAHASPGYSGNSRRDERKPVHCGSGVPNSGVARCLARLSRCDWRCFSRVSRENTYHTPHPPAYTAFITSTYACSVIVSIESDPIDFIDFIDF